MRLPAYDRGLLRTECALGSAAVTLLTAGALTDNWWMLGAGVWALIVTCLIDLLFFR
ncbi:MULTISPECIES: hypothetical protein [Streptomyces]|uniref:hypothetical protein n=1 Tax=Streptomyces TaxID=1883 RepID=UPI000A9EC211|nr:MULTISPECIES: hypothetical protein [Streptomyces]